MYVRLGPKNISSVKRRGQNRIDPKKAAFQENKKRGNGKTNGTKPPIGFITIISAFDSHDHHY